MISCCWNAHVMWNRNWAKSMQHIVLFVFPFFCVDFSRNKYIYGRPVKLKNKFFLCQKSVSWLFFVVPERKIIKFIHKIFVILTQTQKTIELLHLENALPVIGKSVFCFGGGRLQRHMVPGTAIYSSILYNWKCFYVCRRADFANTIP